MTRLPVPAFAGLDIFNPDVAKEPSGYVKLENAHPSRGRLITTRGMTHLQDLEGAVRNLLVSQAGTFSNIYALTDQKLYSFNFAASEFSEIASVTGRNIPFAAVSWFGDAYITKPGYTIKRLDLASVVETDSSWEPSSPASRISARYMIVANNHLMVANVNEGGGSRATRIRWSDLYLPESFRIGQDSEADFFDLEQADAEITGLSYQRGSVIVYTRNSIWQASYSPLPVGYRFQPIFTGVGNAFHYAAIRVNQLEFFIGLDNIYVLDGGSLHTIGDPIWDLWQGRIKEAGDVSNVFASYDPLYQEISWVIDGQADRLVYNVRDNVWSTGVNRNVSTQLYLPTSSRGFLPSSTFTLEASGTIADGGWDGESWADLLMGGDWQFTGAIANAFLGTFDGKIYQPDNAERFPATVSIESRDFFLDEALSVKTIDEILLMYKKKGTPIVKMWVGHRYDLSEALVWSPEILLSTQQSNEAVYRQRTFPGKYFRLRFEFTNTSSDAVTDFIGLELGVKGMSAK